MIKFLFPFGLFLARDLHPALPCRKLGRQRFLQNDDFQHVGNTFAPIHGGFHDLINVLPFDQVDGVPAVLEKGGDTAVPDTVRQLVKQANLMAVSEDFIPRVQARNGPGNTVGGVENRPRKLARSRRGFVDFVGAESSRYRGHGIERVIQR